MMVADIVMEEIVVAIFFPLDDAFKYPAINEPDPTLETTATVFSPAEVNKYDLKLFEIASCIMIQLSTPLQCFTLVSFSVPVEKRRVFLTVTEPIPAARLMSTME